jgi:hypothetical protein
MVEHPILFSGPLVRAILAGAKTQTRRAAKPQPTLLHDHRSYRAPCNACKACPYGQPGDRLWARETYAVRDAKAWQDRDTSSGMLFFRADDERELPGDGRWRPSIHMPRWASRLTLDVTGVRLERLHLITEDDAKAEGVEPSTGMLMGGQGPHHHAFFGLWERINGKRPGCSWHDNPWVWVVEFKRTEQPTEAAA